MTAVTNWLLGRGASLARPYKDLLHLLATETVKGCKHRFITTNWDDLLQREILALDFDVLPSWLDDSHVYHLNGTSEELCDNSQRSPFVLETDAGPRRSQSPELSSAFDKMFWDQSFIVAGMSFECEVDKALLTWLNQVQGQTPIGQSSWLVINPDEAALSASCGNLHAALPRAEVLSSAMTLEAWLQDRVGYRASMELEPRKSP